jgi:hypothetical protein
MNSKQTQKSTIYQNLVPCGFSIIVIDFNCDVIFEFTYRGENSVQVFIKKLFEVSEKLFITLNKIAPLKEMTALEKEAFKYSKLCHICKNAVTKFDIKVRDHCHITGNYRGPAHLFCNLNYQIPQDIPVIIHNLKNFDSNLILKELNQKYFKQCKILPKTTEKFLSFSLDSIKFLDSFQFLSVSLETLVDNLKSSNGEFRITRKIFEKRFGKLNDKKFNLLLRKGVYPYEFIDSFEKFNLDCLPTIEKFSSSLNFSKITIEDFNHAKSVWKNFNCKTMGDYHDIYVLLDTALLGDVFTAFRKKILSIYKLDPCYFYSIPTLAWNSMLKFTGIEIELITDVDMYLFIEKSIRGGISQVSKRYSKANNIYMKENFNSKLDSNYIVYLDGKFLKRDFFN